MIKRLDAIKIINIMVEADTTTINKRKRFTKTLDKVWTIVGIVNDIEEVLEEQTYSDSTKIERIESICSRLNSHKRSK